MGDLKKALEDLSQQRITRQQFLIMVGSSIFGMVGVLRLLQELNTPNGTDLSRADKGVFGEREYGHTTQKKVTKSPPGFGKDAFG